MKSNSRRAFRPQAESLEAKVALSDLSPVPAVQYEPAPILTAPQAPGGTPIPLLTAPGAPDPFTPPAPDLPTGPVLASFIIGGQSYSTMGSTTGMGVLLNTSPLPCGSGTVMMVFPDGTTAGYECTINGTDATNRLQNIQSETDADGQSYMYFPVQCTVPPVVPANLGLSA